MAVVWQFFNQITGKYNIFGAQTLDGGNTWTYHMLSPENVTATNPVLVSTYAVLWEGENENACGNPFEDHTGGKTLSSPGRIPGSVCSHPW
jgi:hypothetical protein